MMSPKYLTALLATLAATSLTLTACGDETDLQCGPGTTEKSGKCIAPETPDPTECGPGTTLNAQTNQCTADQTSNDITCGPGTELDQTTQNCVPIATPPPTQCGPGTILENNTCIAEVTCLDTETPVAGFCLSSAEELAASDNAQNIDEDFELTLPAESEPFIFTGTINEPTEIEGELTQDSDAFTFEGEAGQWLEITLQSLGLPAPAFKIEALIGEDDEPFTYERYSPFGAAAARHVVLPITATYKVTILPEQALSNSGPFGHQSWNYVGTLKNIPTPDATEIQIVNNDENTEELAGTFTVLPQNFYNLTVTDDAHKISLTVEESGSNAFGSILIFSESNTLLHTFNDINPGQTVEFEVPTEPVYALVDWIRTDGPATNYKIQASSYGQRTPLQLDPQSSLTLENFSAPENSVIRLSLISPSILPIAFSILDANGQLLGKVRDVKGETDGNTTDLVSYAFYATGGDFNILAENQTDLEQQAELIVEIIKPTPLGDLITGTKLEFSHPLPARSFNFFLAESVEQFNILNISQLNTQMFYESLVTITVHQADGSITLDDELIMTLDEDGWGAPVELLHFTEIGGPLLIQVENFEYDAFDPFTLFVDPIATTPITSADPAGIVAGESIEYIHTEELLAGDAHWLHLNVAEPIELTALLSALPPGDVDIRGFTTDFNLFLLAEQTGNDNFDVRIPAGHYLLMVSAHADSQDGYTLTATTDAAYLNLTGDPIQSTFEDADEISEIPARINGSAAIFTNGRHQYWKFTATHDTTIRLNMTHLSGTFGMHVAAYASDQTTIIADTVNPLGVGPTDDNRRDTLDVPVLAGETYYLRIGGQAIESSSSSFTYTIKITDTNP